jgi:hypothetical protein
MSVPDPATLDTDELEESLLRLGTWSGLGFVVGALGAVGMYELYPPASSHLWAIPTPRGRNADGDGGALRCRAVWLEMRVPQTGS